MRKTMSKTMSNLTSLINQKAALITAAAVAITLVPGGLNTAHAQDKAEVGPAAGPKRVLKRPKPLEGQPPVRHRKLLVKKRFEAALAFESSINAEFMHTPSFGVKLEYHLSDMLSIGGVGFFGVPIKTGLAKRISETLDTTVPNNADPTPTRAEFDEHLNKMPVHAGLYATWTPWYGKLAAFGKFFLHFDFYFSGGLAFAQLKNDCCSFSEDPEPGGGSMGPDNDPNNDPAINDGSRFGIFLGGGIHVFLNDFIALDLTVRDYLFSDNPSGLDFNGDLAVRDDDNRFLNHLFVGIGVSFLLPSKIKRTD